MKLRSLLFATAAILAVGSTPLLMACEDDDSLGDQIEEAGEEVGDEIDDHTDE